MSDKGPYNIEISNDERVFLYYSLEVMKQAISSSIPYDTVPYKVGLEDAVKYINSVLGIRDKAIQDAAGGDIEKARAFIESLHKKITSRMNT
jgi:hypothetical protein